MYKQKGGGELQIVNLSKTKETIGTIDDAIIINIPNARETIINKWYKVINQNNGYYKLQKDDVEDGMTYLFSLTHTLYENPLGTKIASKKLYDFFELKDQLPAFRLQRAESSYIPLIIIAQSTQLTKTEYSKTEYFLQITKSEQDMILSLRETDIMFLNKPHTVFRIARSIDPTLYLVRDEQLFNGQHYMTNLINCGLFRVNSLSASIPERVNVVELQEQYPKKIIIYYKTKQTLLFNISLEDYMRLRRLPNNNTAQITVVLIPSDTSSNTMPDYSAFYYKGIIQLTKHVKDNNIYNITIV